LFWRLRPNDVDVQLLERTRHMVKGELEEESGLSPGFVENGGLFIASTKERLNEYKRLMTVRRLKADCLSICLLSVKVYVCIVVVFLSVCLFVCLSLSVRVYVYVCLM
jgi:hypothetical protein